MSAQPNPQMNLFSTVPSIDTMPEPEEAVLPGVHARALAAVESGNPGRLAYHDWSMRPGEDPFDVEVWYACNPALGIRISEDYVRAELAALGPAKFSVERLGLWPVDADLSWQVIPEAKWTAASDPAQGAQDPVALSVYTTPDRRTSVIAAAGARLDGDLSFGIWAHAPGTDWVPSQVVTAVRELKPCRLVMDKSGAGANLVVEVQQALKAAAAKWPTEHCVNIDIHPITAAEVGQAYGMVHDALTRTGDVPAWRLWHRDDKRMNDAMAGAKVRSLGREGTTWDTLGAPVVAPLRAATDAVWGFVTRTPELDIGSLVAWR